MSAAVVGGSFCINVAAIRSLNDLNDELVKASRAGDEKKFLLQCKRFGREKMSMGASFRPCARLRIRNLFAYAALQKSMERVTGGVGSTPDRRFRLNTQTVFRRVA